MSIRLPAEAAPKLEAPKAPPRAHAPAPSSTAGERSPFQRMLDGLGKEINHGERAMRGLLAAGGAGADLAPSELLALQAGVYRYGEAVDLASKLVDKASSGVKTVVNGGGQ